MKVVINGVEYVRADTSHARVAMPHLGGAIALLDEALDDAEMAEGTRDLVKRAAGKIADVREILRP